MSKRFYGRTTHNRNTITQVVFSVVRVLIGSYFLATATGLFFEPASHTFFDGVLANHQAQLASTTFLFVAAFAIMIGKVLRPAALMLAIYIFGSGVVLVQFGSTAEALASFWRDMALLGATLLIAVTRPGGSVRFNLWMQPPNRGMTRPNALVPIKIPTAAALPDMEDDNIFYDIWDTPESSQHSHLHNA